MLQRVKNILLAAFAALSIYCLSSSLQFSEAVPADDKALKAKEDIEYSLSLARSYMNSGFSIPDDLIYLDSAIKQYKKILEMNPRHKEALADLASIYIYRGDAVEADRLYQRLSKIDPVFAETSKSKARRKMAAPAVKPATAASSPTAPDKTDIAYELNRARLYSQLSIENPSEAVYLERAVEQYKKILKMSPGERDAIIGLAAISAQKGDLAEAEKLLKNLIGLDPKNMESHLSLALFYYPNGMRDKAREKVDWVIANDPRNGRAHLIRTVMHEDEQDLASAINECKTVIRIAVETKSPDLAIRGNLVLASLYDKAKLYFDAVGQLEKIIKIWPTLPDGYMELARLCYRMGLIDKGISTLNELIRMHPDMAQAYYSLAVSYSRKADYKAAFKYFKKARMLGAKFSNDILIEVRQKIKDTESRQDTKVVKGKGK